MLKTTGQYYISYDHEIKRIEKWVATLKTKVHGCDESEVKKRLIQKIVDLTDEQYIAAQAYDINFENKSWVVVNGIKIDRRQGSVELTGKTFFKSYFQLLAHSAFWWLATYKALLKSPSFSRFSILWEAPSLEETDEKFIAFKEKGPIQVLNSSPYLIVQTPKQPITDAKNILYSNRALATALEKFTPLSLRLKILFLLTLSPFIQTFYILKNPLLSLLARELPLVTLVSELDKAKLLDSMIVTTSFFRNQPLWMKGLDNQRFKLHVLWYSQNFIPKIYKGENEVSSLPSSRHMRADFHWVWTEGFKNYLRSIGQTGEINVVGPIVWQIPENLHKLTDDIIRICVFDVTPVQPGKNTFGAIRNYYTVETISKFIQDINHLAKILEERSGKKVEILLKHKRNPNLHHHDNDYLKQIDDMVARGLIVLVKPDTNLFEMLSNSVLSISVPYTSTAYVADHLGKDAIFYDANAELVPHYEKRTHVHFCAEFDELRRKAFKILNLI